ncbi:class A beta-lactamase-related serine hydrolase [Photorhabdus noenieputensis]|uniref:serine hydrolase domain-containing protein n=1 Tax=Photorhabdus noenieputensis TaxID=1208607 RepID=UPI001BD6ACE6|nr:serine hydrolase domain-containing protein [Photorhabdus noenieputensis]MBS9439510.1 class A beta-lactamase-related serine hydrolase [Photorhabdus noenieputensis]MCK3669671.1 beta-lactamase family protein [Photorhabdus noenieputensis]
MMESMISKDNIQLYINKIDELVNIENEKKGGALAVAIIHDDKIIYQRHIGQASIEHDVAIQPNTKFYLASSSKQFTAFCIALLEKEGKLNVKDKIRQYLDYLPEHFSDITIEHLIHHTSGLRDVFLLYSLVGKNSSFDYCNADLMEKLVQRQQTFNTPTGEYYIYSNTGYYLLGEIIHVVSGKSLKEYAEENIFVPLKMKDTIICDDITEIISNRAMGYTYNENSQQWIRSDINNSVMGSAAVHSTVNDLCRWARAFYSPSIVQDLLPQLSRTPDLTNGNRNNYAYGLIVEQREGQRIIQHNGTFAGFRANVCILPDAKLGMAMTSASDADVDQWTDNYMDILFNTHIEPEKPYCLTSDIDITGIFRGIEPYPYIITKEDVYFLGNLFEKGNQIIFNSDCTFQEQGSKSKFRPVIENDSVIALEYIDENDNVFYFKKMNNEDSVDIQLLSGRYYSHETEAIINIISSGDDIYIDGIIHPVKKEALRHIYGNSYFSPSTESVIDFAFDPDTNKYRLYIGNSRCLNVEFVAV